MIHCKHVYPDGQVCKGLLFGVGKDRSGVPYLVCTVSDHEGLEIREWILKGVEEEGPEFVKHELEKIAAQIPPERYGKFMEKVEKGRKARRELTGKRE